MVAPALVASTSRHGVLVADIFAAMQAVRACQNLIPAAGAVMLAGDWHAFPEIHQPYISHPAVKKEGV